MSFLAIIIALVLVQAWGSGDRVHADGWFYRWQSGVAAMSVMPLLGLALVVLVPVVLAQLLLRAVEPLLFGLPWIAAATLLLLYAFGRQDFHELMERYRGQCRAADFESAFLTTGAKLDWLNEQDNPDTAAEVHRLVQRGFTYEGYQRWFAVLFYFVLLGPAGALAYRLLQLCRHRFEPQLVERCLFLADWAPSRLLAATFALTGDFVRSRDHLLDTILDVSTDAGHLLFGVACAAFDAGPSGLDAGGEEFGLRAAAQNTELGALLRRSAVCWLALISLLVLLF